MKHFLLPTFFSTLLAKFPLGFRNKKIALGVTSKACNSTKEQ